MPAGEGHTAAEGELLAVRQEVAHMGSPKAALRVRAGTKGLARTG